MLKCAANVNWATHDRGRPVRFALKWWFSVFCFNSQPELLADSVQFVISSFFFLTRLFFISSCPDTENEQFRGTQSGHYSTHSERRGTFVFVCFFGGFINDVRTETAMTAALKHSAFTLTWSRNVRCQTWEHDLRNVVWRNTTERQ